MQEDCQLQVLFAVQKNNVFWNTKPKCKKSSARKTPVKSISMSDGGQQPKPAQKHLQTRHQ